MEGLALKVPLYSCLIHLINILLEMSAYDGLLRQKTFWPAHQTASYMFVWIVIQLFLHKSRYKKL